MKLISIIFCLFIVGCASTKTTYEMNNKTKPIEFKMAKILNSETRTFRQIWYTVDPMRSCFEDAKPTDEIITTEPHAIHQIFKMVYYNHSSMNIKKIQNSSNVSDQMIMEAYEEMQIKYDIAYCERVFKNGLFDASIPVTSYRIMSIIKK